MIESMFRNVTTLSLPGDITEMNVLRGNEKFSLYQSTFKMSFMLTQIYSLFHITAIVKSSSFFKKMHLATT